MYSLFDYGEMLSDTLRYAAYSKAIFACVRPGDAVLEIGCGPGVFSLLACEAGARKVYSIESEEIVHHAKELAAENGLANRIEFFHTLSQKVQLPERVDVIIFDLRGSLPFFHSAISAIEDARRRFLNPEGLMIPRRDVLKAAIVEAKEYYSRMTAPWKSGHRGITLSRSLSLVLNACYTTHFDVSQLLTEAKDWGVLDYQSGAAVNAATKICFQADRAGSAHRICAWFEADLANDIAFSSGPSERRGVYGQRFFPWPQEITLRAGQEIQVSLCADLIGDDYIWRWETNIEEATGSRLHFKQSTFLGANFTPEALRRRAAEFVPSLSEEGKADCWLLQAMDGQSSLQQIAQAAGRRFPAIFPRWEDALRRAGELAIQFSR